MSTQLQTTKSTAISKYGDEEQIKFEMQALRQSLPGGMAMRDGKYAVSNELMRGLVIASKFSGLNPYRGEIYALPGVGIMVASKVRAADAQTAAALRGDSLGIRYATVKPGDELWQMHANEYKLSPGDTVRVCYIISSKARQQWFNERIRKIDELKAIFGASDPDMLQRKLNEEMGERAPEFYGIGVVKANENDGNFNKEAEGKFVAFTRVDRADKRALQRTLNKHGLAAPDMRGFGPVMVDNDKPGEVIYKEAPGDVIDGAFKNAPATIENDNVWPGEAAAGQVVEGTVVEEAPVQNELKLRVDNTSNKSEKPFGATDADAAKQVTHESLMKSAVARWSKVASACMRAKQAPLVEQISGLTDPAAIEAVCDRMQASLDAA